MDCDVVIVGAGVAGLSATSVYLARLLDRKIPTPQDVYFHDWRSDPFFRGAYSYAPVDTLGARKILSSPVEETLFFAGEASEARGHSGTVHGAIASGLRSARLALRGM